MSRLRRRAAGAVLATGAALALVGCTPPDDAWVLEPIHHDNQLEGTGVPQPTDVTFPMRLAPDTAGGLWGTSAGSWLHLDASGATVRRFNTTPKLPFRVLDLAAVSPTQLVVTASTGELTSTASAVLLLDTDSMTPRVLQADTALLGQVAVTGDDIYYVRYLTDSPDFVVMRLPLREGADAVAATEALPAHNAVDTSGIALDVDGPGTIYLATRAERITVGPDGEVRERVDAASEWPLVAAQPHGQPLYASGPAPHARPRIAVSDASGDARTVISELVDCDTGLQLGANILPLCHVQDAVWLDDTHLVVSAGGESGAPLLRVTPPLIEG